MNKKYSFHFFCGMFLSLPQFVLASQSNQEQNSSWKLETQVWSIQDHMVAAREKEGEAQSLQSRLHYLGYRLTHFEENPYFDPKGI